MFSYPIDTQCSCPGVRPNAAKTWSWDHTPPSNGEVKNTWTRISTNHTSTLAWSAIKHRDNFRFSVSVVSQSQWPRGLRRKSADARLLRLPGSNSTGGMDVCCECCSLSGRGLSDGPITRPEGSYRLWYVVVCDIENLVNDEWGGPDPLEGFCAKKKKSKYGNVCSLLFSITFTHYCQPENKFYTVSQSLLAIYHHAFFSKT